MVLVPSSQYRYRVEEVLWIEAPHVRTANGVKLYTGNVVASLQYTDPDSLIPGERFHEWESSERVTVFLKDVPSLGTEFDAAALNSGNLYEQYAAPKPALSAEWQQVLEELS